MVDKKLLEVRSQIKSRKPTFRRQQINQFAKFKNDDAWRRPRGQQSKMRLKHRGHRAMPTVGFKSPKAVRGLDKNGLLEVIVKNVADLKAIDSKTQIAVIGRTVGGRKKIDILNEGKKMNASFSNVKNIDKKITELTKGKAVVNKVAEKVEKKADSAKKSTSSAAKKEGSKK